MRARDQSFLCEIVVFIYRIVQIRNFLLRFGNTLVRFDWLVGPRVRWWCSARRECFEEELACRSRVRLCRASQLKCGNCFFHMACKANKKWQCLFLVSHLHIKPTRKPVSLCDTVIPSTSLGAFAPKVTACTPAAVQTVESIQRHSSAASGILRWSVHG